MNEGRVAELYRRYAPAVHAHCRRILGSSAAAGDATQEVFIRALLRGGRLDPGVDGLRFLYRVGTNFCLNVLRSQRVRAEASKMVAALQDDASEPAFAERQLVRKLLARCADEEAEVALLHFIDGMTQSEIALTLGISRRTVFNRLQRLGRLTAELAGSEARGGTVDADRQARSRGR